MDNLPSAPVANTLRQRFIEDMTVRGFSEKTRKYYIRIVAGFAAFLGARRTPPRPRTFAGSRCTNRRLGWAHRQ